MKQDLLQYKARAPGNHLQADPDQTGPDLFENPLVIISSPAFVSVQTELFMTHVQDYCNTFAAARPALDLSIAAPGSDGRGSKDFH